jgi:hypothetical protein
MWGHMKILTALILTIMIWSGAGPFTIHRSFPPTNIRKAMTDVDSDIKLPNTPIKQFQVSNREPHAFPALLCSDAWKRKKRMREEEEEEEKRLSHISNPC